MEEKTIEIDFQGLKLKIAANFKESKGEGILFIHGLGCSKDSFEHVWDFPEFEKFSILTVDLIGFGDSSKTKEFSYNMKDQAEICRLIIEKLDLDEVNLVGHSMGGAIALLLIEKIPERIVSLISLEGNLIGEDCAASRRVANVPYEEFKKSVFSKIKQEIKEAKDGSSELWYEMVCKSDSYGVYHSSKSLVEWSDNKRLLDLFLKLKIDKMYIHGDKNSGIPVLKLIKDKVKTISISNSEHFMMLDNPQEFYQKLSEILLGELANCN